ncbi:hypothetical protein [Leptospira fainei]|uniref:hypothetical protein n=1 Tax=Leptospira fainei TaxID=48782 RepID=UPI0005867B5D|nr:hypothetical protein [Leptospira fainei]
MKNMPIRALRFFLSLTLSISLLFAFGPVRAESQCHGLSKGQCEADSDCTWVSGYQKQSGTNVDAYCRAKPGKAGEGNHSDHHSKKKKDEGDAVKKSESKKSHEKDDEDEEKDSKKVKKSRKDKDEDGDKESKKSKKSKKDKDGDDDKKPKKSKKKKGE